MLKSFTLVAILSMASIVHAQDAASEKKKHEQFIKNLQVGTIFESIKSGAEYEIESHYSYETGESTFEPKKEIVNKTSAEIVLKVENGIMYTYSEDLYDGVKKATVSINSPFFSYIIPLIISFKETKISNDKIFLEVPNDKTQRRGDSDDYAMIVNETIESLTIDAKNFCNTTLIRRETKTTFQHMGIVKELEPLETVETINCDNKLNLSDLNKFDLTSVKVCKYDLEGNDIKHNCEADKDMSFLLN